MTTSLKLIFVLIGGCVIAAVLLLTGSGHSAAPAPSPAAGSVSLPSAGSATGSGSFAPQNTFGVVAQDGSTLGVNDFIHDGETIPDTVNPGSYILAGSAGYCLADGTCPHGALSPDFSISYNDKSHVFTIVLLKEPLGSVRLEAEQFLEKKLGVYDERLCTLNYFLGTPYWVNAVFSGKNLGFSICKGATQLPL